MLLRNLILSAVVASALLPAAAANAQYYDPYNRPPRYDYDRRWDYDRPPPPRYGYDRGYDRPYRARRFGDMCITSRGSCEAPPSPRGSSCRCYIDGFGPKRGAID